MTLQTKQTPLVSIIIPSYKRKNQLEKLINSIYQSTFQDYEIIIVNNFKKNILKDDKKNIVKIIENGKNLGLAAARSIGAKIAKGKYVLFIDDDNIIDKKMIKKLITIMDKYCNIIGVGPKTYYLDNKNKVWFLSVKMNMFTSKPSFFTTLSHKLHYYKKKKLIITDNLHNCFMLRRKDGDAVGWFDQKVFLTGTEFDIFMKIKKQYKGKGILVTNEDAISYHDIPFSGSLLRKFGFTNKKRVYYLQRNRGLLIGRYGGIFNKLALGLVFYPIFTLVYMVIILFNKPSYLKAHLKGTIDGYKALFNKQ